MLVQLIPRDLYTEVKQGVREADQPTLTRMLRTLLTSTLHMQS